MKIYQVYSGLHGRIVGTFTNKNLCKKYIQEILKLPEYCENEDLFFEILDFTVKDKIPKKIDL